MWPYLLIHVVLAGLALVFLASKLLTHTKVCKNSRRAAAPDELLAHELEPEVFEYLRTATQTKGPRAKPTSDLHAATSKPSTNDPARQPPPHKPPSTPTPPGPGFYLRRSSLILKRATYYAMRIKLLTKLLFVGGFFLSLCHFPKRPQNKRCGQLRDCSRPSHFSPRCFLSFRKVDD